MAKGYYLGFWNNLLAFRRAISSSTGAADADEIPRLNVNGVIDVSMLPPSAQGGVEVRDNNNQVLGQAGVLRAGNNVTIELTGGVARISSIQPDFVAYFEPLIPEQWLGTIKTYTPIV